MANGIRTGYPRGFSKGCSSKFCEGSRVRQTPEEGQKTYRPKHCGNNNKDEDNSLKTLNEDNNLYTIIPSSNYFYLIISFAHSYMALSNLIEYKLYSYIVF